MTRSASPYRLFVSTLSLLPVSKSVQTVYRLKIFTVSMLCNVKHIESFTLQCEADSSLICGFT